MTIETTQKFKLIGRMNVFTVTAIFPILDGTVLVVAGVDKKNRVQTSARFVDVEFLETTYTPA